MAELLVRQDDGTYIKIPLKVEVNGVGIVTNPEEKENENG